MELNIRLCIPGEQRGHCVLWKKYILYIIEMERNSSQWPLCTFTHTHIQIHTRICTHLIYSMFQPFKSSLLLFFICTNVNTHWHELEHTYTTYSHGGVGQRRRSRTCTRVCAHTHTVQRNEELIYSMCGFYSSQNSFPRNRWHKLPLSHYLMTKHSHRPPPMTLLNFTLRAVAQEKPANVHTCGKHTPPQIDLSFFFPQLK